MNRRQKIIISVTGIFLVLLILVGLTYAYFLTQIQGNEASRSITVTTAKLELVYSDNTPEVTLTGTIPITTDKVKTEGLVKKFTISKTNESSDVYTTIKLSNLNVSENIALYDMKWALYQGDNPISTGDFGGKTEGEIVLATNQLINTTEGLEYSLHIWINETGIDQSDMMNGTISAILDISGLDKPLNTLASLILGDNKENIISVKPTWNVMSTDRGLFVQQEDESKSEMGFPTYYFRGSATNENEGFNPEYIMNNYVKFGTYKTTGNFILPATGEVLFEYSAGEPIIWRIVRINEDGSIRLISENPVSDRTSWDMHQTYSAENAKYIKTSGLGANIKSVVEAWYDTHIGNDNNLHSKIVTSSFCNNIGNPYIRRLDFEKPNPIFICPRESILAYEKVGLLTGDEILYTIPDAYGDDVYNITYLNSDLSFWTMTTSYESEFQYTRAVVLDKDGFFSDKVTSSVNGAVARAVINVRADMIVLDGDGSSIDPYIIN